MASNETQQRRHERRRAVDDLLSAQRIACQAGNEPLAKTLEAAIVAGVEAKPNERRDPVDRSRILAVSMNYSASAFPSDPKKG